MAKATQDNLTEFGFNKEMFGLDSDVALNQKIVALLDEISLDVADRVGAAAYAAAAGATLMRLVFAEKYFAVAELYRQREVFVQAQIDVSSQSSEGGLLSSQFIKRADDYEKKAEEFLSRVTGVHETSSISVGHVQSGQFTEVEV